MIYRFAIRRAILPASLYRHLEQSETFARNEQKPKRKGAKGSCCLLLYGFEDVTFSTLTEKGKRSRLTPRGDLRSFHHSLRLRSRASPSPHDDGIVDAKDAASLPIEERENDISLRDMRGRRQPSVGVGAYDDPGEIVQL